MNAAPPAPPSLSDRIDALLPQTQCTKCGYAGCRPYADALATGAADINQCPPGGAAGIVQLAQLLQRPVTPLNPRHGLEKPRAVARVLEEHCIGCTLCIQACPVDAIAGAAKQMHAVIAELCTGCDLCVAPCPVDCIVMEPLPAPGEWSRADADAARARYLGRKDRLVRERAENEARLAAKAQAKLDSLSGSDDPDRDKKRTVIEAALARARARRQGA